MPSNDEGSTMMDLFLTLIRKLIAMSSGASLAGRFIPPQTPNQYFYRHEDINNHKDSCSVDNDESGYTVDSDLGSDSESKSESESESSYVAGYNAFWTECSEFVNNIRQTASRNKRSAKLTPPPAPLGTPIHPRFS